VLMPCGHKRRETGRRRGKGRKWLFAVLVAGSTRLDESYGSLWVQPVATSKTQLV